jgi:hypothetical protein
VGVNPESLRELLEALARGSVDVATAMKRLKSLPYEDLGFARVDHHRALRCGFPEVIFGEGKRPAQLGTIFSRLARTGCDVLATRVGPRAAKLVLGSHPAARYHELSRTLTLRQEPRAAGRAGAAAGAPFVAIVCAGTADLPVAEEARITVEMTGTPLRTYYDVGVAGLHRLLAHTEELRAAAAIVVVAGMEGALPSVVGGLIEAPVIAVPTSVGYGASLGGVAALLAMLNSCAPGVSVVNIDNGFGGGYQAAMIARLAGARTKDPPSRGAASPSPASALCAARISISEDSAS